MSEYLFNRASYAIDSIINSVHKFRPDHRKVMREQAQKLLQALNS